MPQSAWVLARQGKYKEAEEMNRRAFKSKREDAGMATFFWRSYTKRIESSNHRSIYLPETFPTTSPPTSIPAGFLIYSLIELLLL
jgi:hypothetical protein